MYEFCSYPKLLWKLNSQPKLDTFFTNILRRQVSSNIHHRSWEHYELAFLYQMSHSNRQYELILCQAGFWQRIIFLATLANVQPVTVSKLSSHKSENNSLDIMMMRLFNYCSSERLPTTYYTNDDDHHFLRQLSNQCICITSISHWQ